MLDVGIAAPGFELPNQDGDPVSLSGFRGRRVVLYFYPRADTPGCTTEACGFRDTWDAYLDRDVTIVGVSDDPVVNIKRFADKYDLPFDLLSDETGAVASRYESYGEKQMFGNTFDGVYRNTYVIGPDGSVEIALEGVSPDGHAEELLEQIDALDA